MLDFYDETRRKQGMIGSNNNTTDRMNGGEWMAWNGLDGGMGWRDDMIGYNARMRARCDHTSTNCERPRLSAPSYKYSLDQAMTNPTINILLESSSLPTHDLLSRRLLCLSEREAFPVPITFGGRVPLSNAAAMTSAGRSI